MREICPKCGRDSMFGCYSIYCRFEEAPFKARELQKIDFHKWATEMIEAAQTLQDRVRAFETSTIENHLKEVENEPDEKKKVQLRFDRSEKVEEMMREYEPMEKNLKLLEEVLQAYNKWNESHS